MKNWFATANFMYRHVFVNSFASSASRVVVRIVFVPSCLKTSVARSARAIGVGADDLGQRPQLLERVTLRDPLRAEGDVDVPASLHEPLGDELRRARIDRAPQHDQAALTDVRRDLDDRLLEDRHRRSQELVHRRPDDDEQAVGATHHRWIGAQLQPAGIEHSRQQLVGAVFAEGHLAAPDPVELRSIDVVDPDPPARVGERKRQREPDVAPAPQHHEIEVLLGHPRESTSGPLGFKHGSNVRPRRTSSTVARPRPGARTMRA